jgi:hypothetical protein
MNSTSKRAALLAAQLRILEEQIQSYQSQDPLRGVRIKPSKPKGTAGKPSQRKTYYRLLFENGLSRAIAYSEVGMYQSKIDAARSLRRCEKRRQKLLDRILKLTS